MRLLGLYFYGDIGQKKTRPLVIDGTPDEILKRLKEEIDSHDDVIVTGVEDVKVS